MSQPQPEQPQPEPQPGASWPPPPPTHPQYSEYPTPYSQYPQYPPQQYLRYPPQYWQHPAPQQYQVPQQYPQYPVPPQVYIGSARMLPRRTTAASYASCALGLVALLLGWVPLVGLGLGVLGLTFGLRALRLLRLGYVTDRAAAVTGIVLSIFGTAIGVFLNGLLLIGVVVS